MTVFGIHVVDGDVLTLTNLHNFGNTTIVGQLFTRAHAQAGWWDIRDDNSVDSDAEGLNTARRSQREQWGRARQLMTERDQSLPTLHFAASSSPDGQVLGKRLDR